MAHDHQKRATRLIYLRDILVGNPRGYTTTELARMTGVHVRSIQRDLNDLEQRLALPVYREGRRWTVLRTATVGPVHLTLPEARAVYLATRLFLHYADEADPAASSALTKLVNHLPQSMRGPVHRTIAALQSRPLKPAYVDVLDTVTRAWAERRVLDVQYRSGGQEEAHQVILEPYFLEASASGYSTYVIGHSRTHDGIRTLKLERIASARLTPETFEHRQDVDIERLLENSWGIMWGEETEVVLRFDPDVTWRVKEAVWHPSQKIEDCADGGCILRMRVGHTMEVAPWVRSWGAAVEVLDPPEFRREVAAEAQRLLARYRTGGD